jgi:transposase-like protein
MAKGVPQTKYSGEFKQTVVETMHREYLGYRETAQRFGLKDHQRVMGWERIYLKEGPRGLYEERRGRAGAASGTVKGREPKPDGKTAGDLAAENQRLRAEVAYLKKLNALVQEEERQSKKRKWSGN